MPSRRCPICSCSCRVGGPDTSRFVSGCRRHKGRAFGSLWALLLSFRDPDGACEQPTARGQSSQDQPAREPRRAAHEASAARQSGQRQRRTTPLRRRRSHSANRHGHMPPDRTRWPLRSTGPHRTSAAHRRAHVRTFPRTREPEGGGQHTVKSVVANRNCRSHQQHFAFRPCPKAKTFWPHTSICLQTNTLATADLSACEERSGPAPAA
jgi:hypothetical protein